MKSVPKTIKKAMDGLWLGTFVCALIVVVVWSIIIYLWR